MTTKSLGKLKILPVNKTVVFYSPVEGDDVLVRTGTIGEGSCFFHALLHSYSKDYTMMDKKDRMKLVLKLRAGLAGKIDEESWENMGGGNIARVPFQENILDILTNFYTFISNKKEIRGRSTRRVYKHLIGNDKDKLEIYEIISELLPLENALEKVILPKSYKHHCTNLLEYKKYIIQEAHTYIVKSGILNNIDDKKSKFILTTISEFITLVCTEAYNSAFKNYKKSLENVGSEVDNYTINFISDRFNRDIYFLDGKTRTPYNNCDTLDTLNGRKSIIVIWINKNHYEIVGRLLPGNRIQREFTTDDPLIKKLNMFLINPEQIPSNYPELSSYIPKCSRDCSDSDDYSPRRRSRSYEQDSEQDSDPYYDDSDADSEESE